MAEISIITPAFNAEKTIRETVESVKKQTFTDWEMIIVDDCSTDKTASIVLDLIKEDGRIKLLSLAENQGVAKARNEALKIATGRFIAFVDSDDLWTENKLMRQREIMLSNGYALTYTAYAVLKTDGHGESVAGKSFIKVPKKMTYKKIFYNTSIACLTVMVDKQKTGEFYMAEIEHTEDQCAWQQALKNANTYAVGINENLAFYRVGGKSLTANKKKAARLQWKTYREYHKFGLLKSAVYFFLYAAGALLRRLRAK